MCGKEKIELHQNNKRTLNHAYACCEQLGNLLGQLSKECGKLGATPKLGPVIDNAGKQGGYNDGNFCSII